MLLRFFVNFLRFVRIFRFRGPSPIEKAREPHVQGHLEEFTLPVFENALRKRPADNILPKANGRFVVFLLVFIVFSKARNTVACKADRKEEQNCNR